MDHREAVEAAARLYPGEEWLTIGRHRFLACYRGPQRSDLPLVVFVPGAAHLARISYGHPEGRPSDFLAYWLDALGYGVLGVSYPGDGDQWESGDLTVAEWGELTAAAIARTIAAHALTSKVIVCGWSMGGRIAKVLNVALSARSIQLEAFISLAGTPAVPGFVPIDPAVVTIRPSGYLDYRTPVEGGATPYLDAFEEDLRQQDAREGRVIIPFATYREEFLAETPISIRGESDRFAQGRFYKSLGDSVSDMGTFDFAEWPIVGSVISSSPRDAFHVLGDKSRWSFFNTQKILSDWLKPPFDFAALPPGDWQALQDIVLGGADRLTEHVPGNHFFFVGEAGARKTAESISRLAAAVSRLKDDVAAIVRRRIS